MISINDLRVRLGGKIILNRVTWNIKKGDRSAILGENGAGKTTLLRAINREIEPESGEISLPKNTSIGYLPQELTEEFRDISLIDLLRERAGIASMEKDLKKLRYKIEEKARNENEYTSLLNNYETLHEAYERFNGYSFDSRAAKVLKGLGFQEPDLCRNCREFSGGWKMRVQLASLLLSGPDILLLDEPTNHLDTESMEWLENWLSGFCGTLVFISHDRRFLDKMAGEICELRSGNIKLYKGNFSTYLTLKEKESEIARRTMDKRSKEIQNTREFIERFRYKASKASQVQSRIKKLEKMMPLERTTGTGRNAHLTFPESRRSGHQVLMAEKISKTFDHKTVFRDIDLSITRGEKIALVGVNGAGKSTLSRLIAQVEQPTSGKVELGYNVQTSFYSQDSFQNLDHSKTVWEEVRDCGEAEEQEKRNLLGSFLFSGDDIQKPVHVLSGGEKSRLALLKILLQDSNFLILDEPTNHLDMKTRELFQEALKRYNGTMVIVSHDRYFLDELVQRVIEIRESSIHDYPGNYSYFIEKRDLSFSDEVHEKGKVTNSYPENPIKSRKRVEAETRNEIYRRKKGILDKLNPLEERIHLLENEIEHTDSLLCDQEVISDSARIRELMLNRNNLNKELEILLLQWEELMELLEKTVKTI
ncbi:MAG: ABC-F family ATP-binding cassette domain-containing protein [Synergistales bacterium]|nr:ABC-F family ATP-binding cassette domain-containing protein [Synergistales bacterium]